MEEMRSIIEDLQRFVADHEGGDYLQVYEADDGPVVWCINQLSKRMRESEVYRRAISGVRLLDDAPAK